MAGSRGVDQRLLGRWKDEDANFTRLLDSVEATEDAYTTALLAFPRPIDDPVGFAEWLDEQADPGESWSFVTTTPDADGQRFGLAVPTRQMSAEAALRAPFVDIHSRLVAWWLTYAWRARQLAGATSMLAEANQVIPAAACARALVETAASFWVDARRILSVWDRSKQAGPPGTDDGAWQKRLELLEMLQEVQFGAKFDDRAPDAKQVYGRAQRSNVLGAIEKLAKVCDGDLQTDYQWLCNTVHPSVGNTLAFSAPFLMHKSQTHALVWFAGRPLAVSSESGNAVERTVQEATARGAITSLFTLTTALDASLRSIDDLGLTTGAPAAANFDYWRALRVGGRNEPCPCRSGAKAKNCEHAWGASAPSVPSSMKHG